MALEDFIPKPVDPSAPKTLDLSLCRQLIARAPKFGRQPGGDTIMELAEQLKMAMDEIAGSSSKIVDAQNQAMRYQREADAANSEVRSANQSMILLREELATYKPKQQPVATTLLQTKKRKTKGKIVPIEQPDEKAAQ